MTDTKPPFNIPKSFHADPYGDHWSFCYAGERDPRSDYDFRVEFTDGVPEPEQAAIVTLLEAAPKLLAALELMVRWTETHGLNTAELITGQRAEVPVVGTARSAIAEATGRAA